MLHLVVLFFKQKTAYEMRISDWSSDVCSSDLMLRVSVSGGGCSGIQYGFSFADTVNADDRTFVRDGVTAVVDETSPELLDGAEFDFVADLGGSAFQDRNSKAHSSSPRRTTFAFLPVSRPAPHSTTKTPHN